MTPLRLLTLNHLIEDQGRNDLFGSCVVISLGYEILKYSIFQSLLDAFKPSAVIDIRVSASFRDHGFTPERTFEAFASYGVEYSRLGDAHEVGSTHHIWMRSCAWFAKGPVFLLGASREHAGSEREQFALELSRRNSIRLLFHEKNSLDRWLLTDLSQPALANVSRVPARRHQESSPAQLTFPLLADFSHK